MIQPVTLLGAGLCFGVLYLRFKSRPKDAPRRKPGDILKTAKILFAALIAWMALNYTLLHNIENLDGKRASEPSFIEKAVNYFSK